jgi:hypothetical protein
MRTKQLTIHPWLGLSLSWLVLLLATSLVSVQLFAGSIEKSCEKKVERWLSLKTNSTGLDCEVVVRKQDDQKSEVQSLYRAAHEVHYCQSKFESHAQTLQNLGWSCKKIDPSNWYCHQRTERRVALKWDNDETHLSCEVSVSRSEENFSKIYSFWRAAHESKYCQRHYESYLQKKTLEGWSCSASSEPQSLAKAAVPSSREPEKQTELESERVPSSESLHATATTKEHPSFFLQMGPTFSFSRFEGFDGLGSQSSVASKGINLGVTVSIEKKFNPTWSNYLSLSGIYHQLHSQTSHGDIQNGNQFLWTTGIGIQNQISSEFTVGSELSLSKQPFLVSRIPGIISIETLNIPELSLQGRYRFLVGSKFFLTTELGLSYLFSRSSEFVHTNSGNAYQLGMVGGTFYRELPIQAQIYFKQRFQNTSLIDWTSKELGFLLALNLELF